MSYLKDGMKMLEEMGDRANSLAGGTTRTLRAEGYQQM